MSTTTAIISTLDKSQQEDYNATFIKRQNDNAIAVKEFLQSRTIIDESVTCIDHFAYHHVDYTGSTDFTSFTGFTGFIFTNKNTGYAKFITSSQRISITGCYHDPNNKTSLCQTCLACFADNIIYNIPLTPSIYELVRNQLTSTIELNLRDIENVIHRVKFDEAINVRIKNLEDKIVEMQAIYDKIDAKTWEII